jgi:very-short-patch-repair endonuclease
VGSGSLGWAGKRHRWARGVFLEWHPCGGADCPRAEVDRRDTRWRRGLRTTTPERTGLDLARWGELNDYLDVALRRGDVTAASVQACLMRMGTLRGHKKAAAASAQISTNPWSPPERHVHGLLTEAGITGWIANARITTAIGDVSPDIAFPDIKFAVEIEGKRYHDEAVDSKAFERDHRREQALSDVGWIILRFTAKQIEIDPLGVLRSIVRKLEQLTAVFA